MTIFIYLFIIFILFLFLIIFYKINNVEHTKKIEKNMNILVNSIDEKIIFMKNYLEKEMLKFGKEVESSLYSGFKDTSSTFTDIRERLKKIDVTQQKIDNLSLNIVSLNDIFTDKKLRGMYGEIHLKNIFLNIFGENSKVYKTQYKLSNNNIVDMIFFASNNHNDHICIDSKFPLNNYKKYVECKDDRDLILYERKFKLDIKKHIDDISNKYIILEETANYALMFIPAEVIFSFINSKHLDLVDYAYKKNVWITSPTTLMAILNLLNLNIKDRKNNEHFLQIKKEYLKISNEFIRYNNRWNNLLKDLDKLIKDVKDIDITSRKIIKSFNDINKLDFE